MTMEETAYCRTAIRDFEMWARKVNTDERAYCEQQAAYAKRQMQIPVQRRIRKLRPGTYGIRVREDCRKPYQVWGWVDGVWTYITAVETLQCAREIVTPLWIARFGVAPEWHDE